MRRIACIAHLSEVSGSGTSLLENAAALRDRDMETFLVLPGRGDLYKRAVNRGFKPVIIDAAEVAITEVSSLEKLDVLSNRIKYVNRLRQFLKREKINLAYINSSVNIFPGLGAKLAGCSIIWHIHETLNQESVRARWKKKVIQRLADGLIFASQSGITAFSPPGNMPYILARNTVHIEELSTVRLNRMSGHSADNRGNCVKIFMAGTVWAKGADILIDALKLDAARQITDCVQVSIAGNPPSSDYGARLRAEAESAGMADRVRLVGLLDSLAPELARADLFVSPSRNEALPISIVEAMAAGVPVIATDVGDCADLLEHGRCGWVVPPEDPQALATAIAEACNNPELARQKADAAYDKAHKLYGNEDFWKPLEKFITEILERDKS